MKLIKLIKMETLKFIVVMIACIVDWYFAFVFMNKSIWFSGINELKSAKYFVFGVLLIFTGLILFFLFLYFMGSLITQ